MSQGWPLGVVGLLGVTLARRGGLLGACGNRSAMAHVVLLEDECLYGGQRLASCFVADAIAVRSGDI